MTWITRAFRRRSARLRIRPALWAELLRELRRRGAGRRESGAFLLSPRGGNGRTVSHVIYFDDIDPDSLIGSIHLSQDAFPKLWDLCDHLDARVIGDVHTHPSQWVEQSNIDADNPLVARRGHVALIVPDFAQLDIGAADVGMHEYHGDSWTSRYGDAAARAIYIGRWA